MASTTEDRSIRPLSADEVMRMEAAGILGEHERVELLHGALTEKPVKSPAHEGIKSRLAEALRSAPEAPAHLVRVEAPLVVRDRLSLPEPDIAVVEPRDYTTHHPTSALLVVEIAVTSLVVDLQVKPPLYAAAGVPELWVVDVRERRVHVFTEPGLAGYASATIVEAGGTITPSGVDAPPLALDALFAGL